jgi:hypothetical protein
LRLNRGDRIEFYWGESKIFDLDLTDVANFVHANAYSNPDPLPQDLNPGVPGPAPIFAFVNTFFENAFINKIIFRCSTQLESARHTIGFYTGKLMM